MVKLIRKLHNRFSRFVIADASDNSVTISRSLLSDIKRQGAREVDVFVFYIPAFKAYGFTINPELTRQTTLARLQYNSKYRSIGFESLCPTVNKIFYDYGLQPNSQARLKVRRHITGDNKIIYIIQPPHYGISRKQ